MDYIIQCVKELYKQYSLNQDSREECDVMRAVISDINWKKQHEHEPFGAPYRIDSGWNPLFNTEKSIDDILASGYIGQAILLEHIDGGNAWESDVENKPASVLVNAIYLDHILEGIAPQVTYLTYRKIERELFIHKAYTRFEYYQNNDHYLVQLISIESLLQTLQEKKVLLSEEEIKKNMNMLG